MKISLKRLTLTNFKGIRYQDIKFSDITNISGENATGKTTIFDAFLWLFFGKDSTDRKDFEIKTLDENNQPYHNLDHEVSADVIVDGESITIKRSLRENWVKKRGEQIPVFSGHTTSYFWNEVPLKLEEFQGKIDSLLKESIFKLITNTGYFNGMKWQDRRSVLLQIAGTIDERDVIDKLMNSQNKHHYTEILNALNQKKSVEEFKRELASKKKRIREEMELIPARVDEANRSLPDEEDYESIQSEIDSERRNLESVETLLTNKSEAQKRHQQKVTDMLKEIQALTTEKMNLEFEIRNSVKDKKVTREQKLQDLNRLVRTLDDDINRLVSDYKSNNARLTQLVSERDVLYAKWDTVNAEKLEFKEGEFHCPACKRAYDTENIEAKREELTRNFNTDKSKRLNDITAKGKEINEEIALLETRLSNLKADGETKRAESAKAKADLSEFQTEHIRLTNDEVAETENAIKSNSEYLALVAKIDQLTVEVNKPVQEENTAALNSNKRAITDRIDALKKKLAGKENREKTLARIAELKKSEEEMSNQLAGFEGIEYAIEQLTKAKMDELVNRINGRFNLVTFKLFEKQINGGEVECCETLIKGVPYSDANTASKINAGLDIINTLQSHYGVSAPVFVDNAESVNTLLPVNTQLIRLVVSKDKKLKIENETPELAAAM